MAELPGWVELEAAAIVLGVDDEYAARADHQVVEVGSAAGDGQVVQDHPSLPLQGAEQPGGVLLPCRPAPPGDGVGAVPEPQSPAGCHGREHANHQAEPGRRHTARDSCTDSDAQGRGDPPEQGPGPGGPLGRPQAPPPGLGGAARPAHRGPDPDRHHRPIGTGSSQRLFRVIAGEVGEDGLQVGLAEGPHRPTRPVVVVVEGPGSRAGHRACSLSVQGSCGQGSGSWGLAAVRLAACRRRAVVGVSGWSARSRRRGRTTVTPTRTGA
jgi:hypothetical protein